MSASSSHAGLPLSGQFEAVPSREGAQAMRLAGKKRRSATNQLTRSNDLCYTLERKHLTNPKQNAPTSGAVSPCHQGCNLVAGAYWIVRSIQHTCIIQYVGQKTQPAYPGGFLSFRHLFNLPAWAGEKKTTSLERVAPQAALLPAGRGKFKPYQFEFNAGQATLSSLFSTYGVSNFSIAQPTRPLLAQEMRRVSR